MENLKCFLIVNPSLNSQIYIQSLVRKKEVFSFKIYSILIRLHLKMKPDTF